MSVFFVVVVGTVRRIAANRLAGAGADANVCALASCVCKPLNDEWPKRAISRYNTAIPRYNVTFNNDNVFEIYAACTLDNL